MLARGSRPIARRGAAALLIAAGLLISSGSGLRADHNPGELPLTIQPQVQDLRFGRVAGNGTASSRVTIDSATGTKTVSGGAFDLGGADGPARLIVRGEPGHAFLIILPGPQIATGRNNPSNQVIVKDFESTPSGSGVIGPNGKTDVTVGGTLEMAPNQPADRYSVTVPFEAVYP